MNKSDQLQFVVHTEKLNDTTHAAALIHRATNGDWLITVCGGNEDLVVIHHLLGRYIEKRFQALDPKIQVFPPAGPTLVIS